MVEEARDNERSSISRRKFIKTAAAGATGLGFTGIVSGFSIISENPVKFFNGTAGDKVNGSVEAGNVKADNIGENKTRQEKEFHGNVYAPAFNGKGLASKVENALEYLKNNRYGRGRVIIPARSDGDPWIWDKQLTIDPTSYHGLEIIAHNSAQINYPGENWVMHIDTTWDDRSQNGIRVIGGKWKSTGKASGWIRSDDTYRAHYSPDEVVFPNSGSRGVQVRNMEGWSEEYLIGGRGVGHIKADVAIELLGATETGGSGTDSHHGAVIRDLATIKGDSYGVKVEARMQYGGIYSCTFRPWKKDGARCLYLNPQGFDDKPNIGRLDGFNIFNCKWEDASGDPPSGEVAVYLGPRFDNFYGPVVIGCHGYLSSLGEAHPDARNPEFLNLKMQAGYHVYDWISGEKKKIVTE